MPSGVDKGIWRSREHGNPLTWGEAMEVEHVYGIRTWLA